MSNSCYLTPEWTGCSLLLLLSSAFPTNTNVPSQNGIAEAMSRSASCRSDLDEMGGYMSLYLYFMLLARKIDYGYPDLTLLFALPFQSSSRIEPAALCCLEGDCNMGASSFAFFSLESCSNVYCQGISMKLNPGPLLEGDWPGQHGAQ
jgi:hypothetical protein